jgi:hypothetical protein
MVAETVAMPLSSVLTEISPWVSLMLGLASLCVQLALTLFLPETRADYGVQTAVIEERVSIDEEADDRSHHQQLILEEDPRWTDGLEEHTYAARHIQDRTQTLESLWSGRKLSTDAHPRPFPLRASDQDEEHKQIVTEQSPLGTSEQAMYGTSPRSWTPSSPINVLVPRWHEALKSSFQFAVQYNALLKLLLIYGLTSAANQSTLLILQCASVKFDWTFSQVSAPDLDYLNCADPPMAMIGRRGGYHTGCFPSHHRCDHLTPN